MTEELVTLETAEMLKEKGFDIPVESISKFCCNLLQKFGVRVNHDDPIFFYDDRPPQSLAQKWLRETRKLHVEVSYMHGDYWIYDILTIPNHDLVGLSDRPLVHYKSYEEALEAGIFEALKLV
jgi:hypothetical protein